jgi:hypothetical protein
LFNTLIWIATIALGANEGSAPDAATLRDVLASSRVAIAHAQKQTPGWGVREVGRCIEAQAHLQFCNSQDPYRAGSSMAVWLVVSAAISCDPNGAD